MKVKSGMRKEKYVNVLVIEPGFESFYAEDAKF